MQIKRAIAALALTGTLAAPAYAQLPPNPTQRGVSEQPGPVPVFRVTVVAHTIPAVNYRNRKTSEVDFRGTALMPQARGEAKIEGRQGRTAINAELKGLEPATTFGPEYLTYVMWAITPEGRANNLGEVLLDDSKSRLNVTTDLQMFGLVVTAEPYFAVTQPSDVVVMENVITSDTEGQVEQVEAKYELLKRGTYLMSMSPSSLRVHAKDSGPLELREARNAVQLSQFAGADVHAADTFTKARDLLDEAEHQRSKDACRKTIVTTSRAAAQTAEDARLISLQRQEEEYVAAERRAAAEREARAAAIAADEARRRREAEEDLVAAERSRAAAEKAKSEAESATARLEQERLAAEAARVEAEHAKAKLDTAVQDMAQRNAEIEAARQAAAADARIARQAAEAAEREKAELRARLQQQLNLILETRETARGLIVTMSDVLFDTDQATLKPGAREKLSKVAGILLAYPGLTLEVDGHTDSVGTDSYNQSLSERRAASVRDYLMMQGVGKTSGIAMRAFGETMPVATNGTAAGRQQNRRVELIVSGEPIGWPTGTPAR